MYAVKEYSLISSKANTLQDRDNYLADSKLILGFYRP